MAKLLFAVAFLNLPLFLSDCLILQSLGLPLDMSHLLLRQLPLWALVIVPAFAIAAISRNVSQFTLLLVALILVLILSGFLQARLNLHISDVLVVLSLPLAALPVVVIQFAKRATFTRFLLAAIVAVLLPAAFFTAHLTQDGAFFLQNGQTFRSTQLGRGFIFKSNPVNHMLFKLAFPLKLHIPAWAQSARVLVNGTKVTAPKPGTF